ncbi:DM13 domain-containing protein, partial [Streptomyces sp. T21Q-yed]
VAPSPADAAAPAPGPQTLAGGELISHEHTTSGSVKLVRLADGSHVVRLEDLDTSNGPDLRVWLTDAPVKEGRAGWHVFDDGEYVSLGRLKGNKGSQNYVVPEDVDLSRYSSVTLWCDRFDVSFGAAELARA